MVRVDCSSRSSPSPLPLPPPPPLFPLPPPRLFTCHTDDKDPTHQNQEWTYNSNGTITSVMSGKCMDSQDIGTGKTLACCEKQTRLPPSLPPSLPASSLIYSVPSFLPPSCLLFPTLETVRISSYKDAQVLTTRNGCTRGIKT